MRKIIAMFILSGLIGGALISCQKAESPAPVKQPASAPTEPAPAPGEPQDKK
ncbi:MAG: hypothetical protein HY758_02465 [Nitrospirae bacterium]|nr:hypothetical protein [Nitrospirota bacterium]